MEVLNQSGSSSTVGANSGGQQHHTQELKKINLSGRKIYNVDPLIREFSAQYRLIRELNLDDNLLGEIPAVLRELKQLDVLSMVRNYIMEIPKWVSTEFKVLRRLNLSHNTIQKLPDTFQQMNLLEDLDLSYNIISYIPPSHFPHNLVSLNLSNNQFQEIELPPWHENLLELDISCNKLRYLGQIPYHLTKISIDDNRLLSIDHKVIQRYRDLRLKFNQSFNDVVLERIYQCWYNGDQYLDLSGIGLSHIPPVLGHLTHLTSLDISGNCLSSLPPELETLTQLIRLDLSYNIITTLPLYFLNFKNLQFLGLQGTLDTLVSPPKKIAEGGMQEIIRYFQDLFVGDPSYRVKLMIVGQENVGKTSLVKCLKMKKKFNKGFDHLGSNVSTDGIDIDEIKFSLSIDTHNHHSNKRDYLENIVINTIGPAQNNQNNPHISSGTNSNSTSGGLNAASVAQNTNSTGTNSGSNSGVNSDNSSSNNPTSSAGAQARSLFESNSQIVTTGSSSQTSQLLNTTITNQTQQQQPQTQLTTQKITISIWDCAGQELYYTSHQMFLTDSALYTVVWDLCKPEVNSRVDFWLHSIRSKAETAPIILVGTHLDNFLESHSEQELDEILQNVYTKYFRKFRLKGICVVSCSTGNGFENFQDLLKRVVSDLPSIKQPLPELYTKMEKLIIKKRTNLSPPILTWHEFSQLILSNLDFHDEVHVKVATKSLVNLGIISYFDEPVLENYVFLDPQWLPNVFASIITTKHKFIKDGILKRSDLYQIWKPPNFLDDAVLHGLLITLLERFELMFPLDNSQTSQYTPSQISSMNLKASNHQAGSPSSSTDSLNDSNSTSGSNLIVIGTNRSSSSLIPTTTKPQSPQLTSRHPTNTSSPKTTSKMGTTSKKKGSALTILANDSIPPITEYEDQKEHQSTNSVDLNQKFMIPTQLPEKRPSFDLLWPPSDQSRIEYNRWFQLAFVPSGLFSRLLIRFMTSKEFDIKPILFWRNGVIVESSSGKGYLSTSMALIEMVPNFQTGTTTLMISVRGNKRTGKAITAKLLRLIVEITDTLCTSWYHLELIQVIPCPHCIGKAAKLSSNNGRTNYSNCKTFSLETCEMAASQGEWSLQCGTKKIALESFVPDVAMSDFWGTGSKKYNYDQIELHKVKRVFSIKPSEQVGSGYCEVKVTTPIISTNGLSSSQTSLPNAERSLTNDLPIICTVKTVAKDHKEPLEPIQIIIDQKTQTIQIVGQIVHQGKDVEIELDLPKLIGRGASGKIYRAEMNGTLVAVKQLDVVGEDAPRIFSEFRKEIHVMSDLKHPNVVNLIGFTLNPFTMIMEYIDCGDLHKFLHSPAGDILNGNWALILKLALDIAQGMDFLHSVTPPLLHRDLKSPNILLAMKNGHYQAKVGDFGLSSRMFIQSLKHKLRNFPVGNITWVAPEILKEEEYTIKSDVYAFGLILHELLTRKHPYKEFNYQMVSLLEEQIKNKLRPTIPFQYSQTEMGHEYCALIRDCWDDDVERRPTFSKIVKRLNQIIQRDISNDLTNPDSPLYDRLVGGTASNPKTEEIVNIEPPKTETVVNPDDAILGGLLQMNIRAPMECNIHCLVWENRRVWCGCDNGSIVIWNAENGTKLLHENKIHPGPIHNLVMVDEENVWSTGGIGSRNASIRVWNAWRLNVDDQPRFKSDNIRKKSRSNSVLTRGWNTRWFVLDTKSKTLNYYGKQTDKQPKACYKLEEASIETSAGSPNRMIVTITQPERTSLELEFKNEHERDQWAQAITRLIEQNIPISEMKVEAHIPPSDQEYITNAIVINGQVWVTFKIAPLILIYNAKTKTLIKKIELSTLSCGAGQWKGINKIILHQGFIWMSSDNLLAQIDTKSYQVVNIQCQHQEPILSIASVDNQVWISSADSSISIWDGLTATVSKRIESKSPVTKLFHFSGYVWAASFSNISIYDPQTCVSRKQVDSKLHPNSIEEIIRVFHQTVWSIDGSNNMLIWS